MSKPLIWLLGLVGLALLTVGCVALHAPRIEADLTSRTSAALARAGLAGVSPQLDGRDVTLVGRVPSDDDRARAVAAAAGVDGVRAVRDRLGVGADGRAGTPEPSAGAPFAGLFALTESGGGLTLSGRLPSDDVRAGVLQRVGAAFPGRTLTDRMSVDAGAADWSPTIAALLPALGSLTSPGVEIDGTEAVLRGTIATEADRARVEASARAGLSAGVTLRSEITVGDGTAAADSGAAAGTTGGATAAADQIEASGEAALAAPEAALAEALALGRIEFESGTARLTDRSRQILDRVATVFTRFPDVAADVNGYTDDQGDAGPNRTLSTRRAEATRDYLVQKGVDADRLAPRGYGEADPVADNGTADGRARNRRVVFAPRSN